MPLAFSFRHRWRAFITLFSDSKGSLKKVPPLTFYSRPLFRRTCDFNIFLHSGCLFHQYLSERFVKVDSERFHFLRRNQLKPLATDYTHLSELLAKFAITTNEMKAWAKRGKGRGTLEIYKLTVILPSIDIGSQRSMGQNARITPISNLFEHPDFFPTRACRPKWPKIKNAHIHGQRADDRPDICDLILRIKWRY